MRFGFLFIALIISLVVSLLLSMVFHAFIFLGMMPLLFVPLMFGTRRRW